MCMLFHLFRDAFVHFSLVLMETTDFIAVVGTNTASVSGGAGHAGFSQTPDITITVIRECNPL